MKLFATALVGWSTLPRFHQLLRDLGGSERTRSPRSAWTSSPRVFCSRPAAR
jgi:hypothetical protein